MGGSNGIDYSRPSTGENLALIRKIRAIQYRRVRATKMIESDLVKFNFGLKSPRGHERAQTDRNSNSIQAPLRDPTEIVLRDPVIPMIL